MGQIHVDAFHDVKGKLRCDAKKLGKFMPPKALTTCSVM